MAVAGFARVKTNAQLASAQPSKVVTSNGITITGISDHAYKQMASRKVSLSSVTDALTKPLHIGNIGIDCNGRPSQRLTGFAATAAVNTDTGNIATVWPTSSARRKKYGGAP